MTDPLSRYESMVEQQIRMAQERGDFDNLPGMGKPIPGWGSQDDELWWVKQYISREGLSTEALLPTSLRLAKEIDRLPETVRKLPSEQAVREAVGELNRRIVEHLRAPSGPQVPIRPVDPDQVVEQWREARGLAVDQAVPAAMAAPAADPTPEEPSRQRGHWRRWFGRGRRKHA